MIRVIRWLFICLSIFILSLSDNGMERLKAYVLGQRTVHVFVDEATFAAFQQMIYALELPQESIKIVWWKRYYTQSKKLSDYQKNVIVPFNEKDLFYKVEQLGKEKNIVFEFHMNVKHIGATALQSVTYVPPEKVYKIHLYEDSASHIYRKNYSLAPEAERKNYIFKLKKMLRHKKASYYFPYLNTLPAVFPIVFHVTYLEKMKQDFHYKDLFNIPNLEWKNFDIHQKAHTLSPTMKKNLFEMIGFDVDSIRETAGNKNIGILLLTWRDSPEKISPQNKQLYDSVQQNKEKEGTVWFIKNHPALGNYIPMEGFHLIPSHIPLEALILAQLPIGYAAGQGTSAFFSLDQSKIIAYIPHYYSFYLSTLIEFGLLKPEAIIK